MFIKINYEKGIPFPRKILERKSYNWMKKKRDTKWTENRKKKHIETMKKY